MSTKEQNTGGSSLTARQKRSIGFLVGAPTLKAGMEAAGISCETYWRWSQEPAFAAELSRQRNEVIEEALGILKRAMLKAVVVLVDLLGEPDPQLRRFAACDILNFVLRIRENLEIEERVRVLEERLK